MYSFHFLYGFFKYLIFRSGFLSCTFRFWSHFLFSFCHLSCRASGWYFMFSASPSHFLPNYNLSASKY